MKVLKSLSLFGCLAFLIALNGCGANSNESTTSPPASDSPTNDGKQGGKADAADEGTDKQTDMEKMKAALAKLSPEDAKSAEKQHVCPVSGEMLGTMGPPEKVDVNGETVWICCDGCREKLLSDPDKYLAKLQKE